MSLGLASGIGQALVAGASEYQKKSEEERDRLRREDIQNTQLTRQTELWNEQQNQKQAEDDALAQQFDYGAGPTNPIQQHADAVNAIQQGPAAPVGQDIAGPTASPEPASTAPGERPQPAPTGAPAPQGIAKVNLGEQPAPPPSPAQSQAPSAPLDPEATELNNRYQVYQKRFEDAAAKIKTEAAGDPKKERQLKAGYMRVMKGDTKLQSLESDFQNYQKNIQAKIASDRSNAFVDAALRNDIPTLEGMFGKGTRPGKDPVTGLQGVFLADGKTFIGQGIVAGRAMLKAGLIDQKQYAQMSINDAKITQTMLKDAADNAAEERMRARSSISAHVGGGGEGGNKTLQVADDVQKTAEAQAKMDNPKASPDEIRRAGLKARADYLNVPVTKAATGDNTYLMKLQGQKLQKTQAIIKNSVATDSMGTTTAKIDGKTAYQNFVRLTKEDPDMGLAYRGGLTPELNAAIDAGLSQDASAPKKPTPPSKEHPLAKMGMTPDPKQPGTYMNKKGVRFRDMNGSTEAWSNTQSKWIPVQQ